MTTEWIPAHKDADSNGLIACLYTFTFYRETPTSGWRHTLRRWTASFDFTLDTLGGFSYTGLVLVSILSKSVRQKAIWKSRRPRFSLKHSLRNIQLKIRAGQAEVMYLRFIVRTGVPNSENWSVSEHAQGNTSFSNMGGAFFNFTNGGSSL